MVTEDSLFKLHEALCHPGVTRLNHFVRTKNLPYSLDEIKKMTSRCPVCCECKPQFHRPEKVPLVKATQPFERINIDLKCPLPTNNGNKYFLMVVDEYFRFPFVFPCPDVPTNTVIKCLTPLFSLFGMPAYVHSDRGASFTSRELREFLFSKGVASSRTINYNPEGNGQAERCNGVIWKAVTMRLRSKNLPLKNWQDVLPDVLHSVRSLLITATNETPHERFFDFSRRSSAGASIPTWLGAPGSVYIKRQVRTSKMDPLVDEVGLLQANPHYAHVRYPDARETTVARKHLAPKGQVEVVETLPAPERIPKEVENLPLDTHVSVTPETEPSSASGPVPEPQPEPAPVRRSQRVRRPVVKLDL